MRRLLLIAIILSATSLFGEDLFTLYVPVQVSRLHPSVTQVGVRCTLNGPNPATGSLTTYGPVGGKSQFFTPVGGAYTGTATIVFTNSDFVPSQLSALSSVNAGRCELILIAGGAWYYPYPSLTGSIVGHAAGTPFSNPVTFPIH